MTCEPPERLDVPDSVVEAVLEAPTKLRTLDLADDLEPDPVFTPRRPAADE